MTCLALLPFNEVISEIYRGLESTGVNPLVGRWVVIELLRIETDFGEKKEEEDRRDKEMGEENARKMLSKSSNYNVSGTHFGTGRWE